MGRRMPFLTHQPLRKCFKYILGFSIKGILINVYLEDKKILSQSLMIKMYVIQHIQMTMYFSQNNNVCQIGLWIGKKFAYNSTT